MSHEPNPRAQLLEVVRQVRRRWRIKLALRGAVGFLIAGWLLGFAHGYARCWLVTREAADEDSDSPDVTERIRRRGRGR